MPNNENPLSVDPELLHIALIITAMLLITIVFIFTTCDKNRTTVKIKEIELKLEIQKTMNTRADGAIHTN